MTSQSIEAPAERIGGGFPTPPTRSATVTITDRAGDRVIVSTWDTCTGTAAFVARFLGEPSARAETKSVTP
jgi:hypothetical protein